MFPSSVTWFTELIYSSITFCVANGDACPFIGHNALLSWRAIQDATAYTDEDGYEKYWSECHVSEDFEMSMRLQVAGYTLRYASYTGDGFKEGVSLTVYDELARWEKYAYGCNELLFHPLRFWITRGPFTPLFREFITSGIPLPKKVTIMAYIGTYYAIAAAWCVTLANYFITGWYYGAYDKYYLDSFAIYLSIIVVFSGFGNVALAMLRYRLGEKSLIRACMSSIPLFRTFPSSLFLSQTNNYLLCSLGKHPMGPHVHHLPGRDLHSPFASYPVSLLRDRHGLGRNSQRVGKSKLWVRDCANHSEVQVHFCFLFCLHGPHDLRLGGFPHPVADPSALQHLPPGLDGHLSFCAAGIVEPGADDVYLVKKEKAESNNNNIKKQGILEI